MRINLNNPNFSFMKIKYLSVFMVYDFDLIATLNAWCLDHSSKVSMPCATLLIHVAEI